MEVFSFSPASCWFLSYTHPATKEQCKLYIDGLRRKFGGMYQGTSRLPDPLSYPTSINDVPTEDRGVRLGLTLFPDTDPSILRFNIVLSSSKRPVWREVVHRDKVVVPLLFALLVDGTPLRLPERGFVKEGGMQQSEELIPRGGGERRWLLKVDAASVRALLPDDRPHILGVAAAFSERQRFYIGTLDSMEREAFVFEGEFAPPPDHEGPQVLVRSEAANIQWTGKEWKRTDR